MRCHHCGQLLQIFRLNPEKARVEPYCEHCKLYYETAPDPLAERCSGCGLDFTTIRFSERLGCERCYDTFRDSLLQMLKKAGKRPSLFERPAPGRAAMARHCLLHELLEQGHVSGEEEPAGPLPGVFEKPGPGEMIVRLRVARNIPGIPYLSRLPAPERGLLREYLLAPGSSVVQFFEKRLSENMQRTGSVCRSADGRVEIRADDEDHLRLAFFLRLQLPGTGGLKSTEKDRHEFNLMQKIDDFETEVLGIVADFDAYMWFQAHPLFGYLTACPSNAGSGMRMSVRFQRMSDPVLWLAELRRSGLSVRGSAGEGSAIENSATVLLPVKDRAARRRIIRLFLSSMSR